MTAASWRDIPCDQVDWEVAKISKRITYQLWRQCRSGDPDASFSGNQEDGPWKNLTLGQLANMGERAWQRTAGYGIGPKAVETIKATINMAAEGVDVLVSSTEPGRNAYVPLCERTVSE